MALFDENSHLVKFLQAQTDKVAWASFKGQKRVAKCTAVHDGDTTHLIFCADESRPEATIGKYSCRYNGYNSAEINSKDPVEKKAAIDAKHFLESLILGRICMLELGAPDKYGRPLVDVWVTLPVDHPANTAKTTAPIHVNELMIKTGHGKPYTGRGEKTW